MTRFWHGQVAFWLNGWHVLLLPVIFWAGYFAVRWVNRHWLK